MRRIYRVILIMVSAAALVSLGVPSAFAAVPTITSFSPTSGLAGCTVDVTGTGFTDFPAAQVQVAFVSPTNVATNASDYQIISATELWAVVPAGLTPGTSYNIRVSTPAGTSTSTGTFLVTSGPGGCAPTITSFSPTSGAVGTLVTITGTNFVGATSVKFNGTAASFAVVSDTQIRTIVPTGATTGPISVTTLAGTATSTVNFTVVGPESFSVKCVLHIVVTNAGVLSGSNGIAGMDCTSVGPVKIQEVKATAEIPGPQNLRIAWSGEVSFTEPVSGFRNIAGITNPEFLPLNIQSFETKLATVNKLPGFDFALSGAAGITNPEAADVGLEVSGNINPEF